MTPREELRKRAAALRLHHKEIAKRAEIDANTVTRLFAPDRTILHSTYEKVEKVIADEEEAMRTRLAGAAQ